ncbi:MAG: YmdB family metallophosphoesterase, partial [Eubacteriales bacterium]|nr:YmdB family metallophosphoesterase [Eubacteriales bacterium]
MNILFIGDVVGAPGRKAIRDKLYGIIRKFSLDIVIANGENSAAGLGMTRQTADDMFDQGVDIITMGNHTWSKSDIFNFIDDDKRVIRPANVS